MQTTESGAMTLCSRKFVCNFWTLSSTGMQSWLQVYIPVFQEITKLKINNKKKINRQLEALIVKQKLRGVITSTSPELERFCTSTTCVLGESKFKLCRKLITFSLIFLVVHLLT